MKRPMCTVGLSISLATWAAFWFPAGQSLLLSAAALSTAVLAVVLRVQRPEFRWLRAAALACFTAALAFGLHTLYEVRSIRPFVEAEGETVLAEGIIEEARLGKRVVYYTLAATFPQREDLPDTTMTLRAYGEMDYVAGDVIRCKVRLAPKQQPETGLRLAKDRFLEGYLQGKAERLEGGYPFRRGLIGLRQRLQNNVYRNLHETSADIVSAMVLGMTDNVSAEVYSAVNRSGTVHLLSISGLHLSILTAFVLSGLEKLRLSRRLRTVITIAACFSFAVLVGFSASIVRSSIMTAIALAAGISNKREGDSLSALGLAATVICLAWPGWILGKGFWLSAGSTLGIIVFSRPLYLNLRNKLFDEDYTVETSAFYHRVMKLLLKGFATTAAAYTVTLPFLVLFYGWFSIVAPLTNILVSPFIPFIIVGGIVCAVAGGTLLPVRIVAAVTDLATAAVLRISQLMAGLPFATVTMDEGWMLIWVALVVGVAVWLLLTRAPGKLAAYAAALMVLAFSVGSLTGSLSSKGTVELATIQNCDAAVLIQGDEAVILGTPAYYEVNQLLRYLEFRGVRRIRGIVAADCGEQIGSGLLRVCRRYPVDCIIGPNDSYILRQLATAVPDVPVYSGGYATIQVLGGARVAVTVPDGNIEVRVPANTILKTADEYDIMKVDHSYTIGIYAGGDLVLQGATGLEAARIGNLIYGETRFRLRL